MFARTNTTLMKNDGILPSRKKKKQLDFVGL